MTLNSFNQMRYEEFIESVQAPFWLEQRQIISGLHVNVGWYSFLLILYKLFGFSLNTAKLAYLVLVFFSNMALFYLLRRFFKIMIASIILLSIILSPTYLYMNALDLHWALTFYILIFIILLLYLLDFAKKRLSMLETFAIFFLMMWGWLSYQAFVFYIPSLIIFYLWKLKKFYGFPIRSGMTKIVWRYLVVSAVAFLLPLIALFIYVDNRHILIADKDVGGGLFRGGGKIVLSEEVFSQSWTDFMSDFFVRGVSHHYEVNQAEFSLIFPIITLLFLVYALIKVYTAVGRMKRLILLVVLVICFDIAVFSTTSDFGLPGMKRLTPMLASIYFLWVMVWWAAEKKMIRMIWGIWGIRVIMGLLLVHHLIVFPINLTHIKDPSPFKVTYYFDEDNPQKTVDELALKAQKEDLLLDCRPIVNQGGQCSYDFIYPAVAGSCLWNHLNCHDILGYDPKTAKFIPLSVDLWQNKYFDLL